MIGALLYSHLLAFEPPSVGESIALYSYKYLSFGIKFLPIFYTHLLCSSGGQNLIAKSPNITEINAKLGSKADFERMKMLCAKLYKYEAQEPVTIHSQKRL
jgi:hypothetical protein